MRFSLDRISFKGFARWTRQFAPPQAQARSRKQGENFGFAPKKTLRWDAVPARPGRRDRAP